MTRKFSTSSVSAILAGFWLFSFILSLAIPGVLSLRKAIESDTLTASLDQLSSLYAPYIGAILAYFFVLRSTQGRGRVTSATSFIIALLVSSVWNFLVVGILAQVLFSSQSIEEALKLIAEVSPKLSWLVAPVMGYFFAKSENAKRS